MFSHHFKYSQSLLLLQNTVSVRGQHCHFPSGAIYDIRIFKFGQFMDQATGWLGWIGQNLQYYNVCTTSKDRSVCALTHYVKQASWKALNPQTVHTVWSSKGLILGGGGPIYGIVRMCVPNSPFFQHCQVYDWSPFFSTKSIWMARFFWIPMWKGPFFWHPVICTFFVQRFFEAAYPLGITWIDCDICVTTSKKWVQKSQRIRQHFRWSSIWMGSSPPPPPPPPPPTRSDQNVLLQSHCWSRFGQSGYRRLIRSANALIRMCSCADSSEYSLVAQDVLLHPEITGGT